MYENLSGVQHRSAIVDVTDRCNLRCKHCFYYREEHESEEMEADEFLEGLRTLKDAATRDMVRRHAEQAGLNPDAVESMVAGESGGNPKALNPKSRKHAGLIQFSQKYWPGIARAAGQPDVSWQDMQSLSAEEQMPFVVAYFKRLGLGPDDGPEEYNLAGFMPAALRKPDTFVLGRKGSKEQLWGLSMHKVWEQNPGLRDPTDPDTVTVMSAKSRGDRGAF